jgi:hypothetical protein
MPKNPYIYHMISIRNNAFVNVSFNKYGLLTSTKNEYINTQIFIENNYFENIASVNTDMPMINL